MDDSMIGLGYWVACMSITKRKQMEKVWEVKWVQLGPAEFKAYSDENIQEIVRNMDLKLWRERLKLGVISIKVVSLQRAWNLFKKNWGLRRRVKKGRMQLKEKRKEAVTAGVASQQREEHSPNK